MFARKLVMVLVLGAIAAGGMGELGKRYELAFDVQKFYSCLPYNAFVVEKNREVSNLKRGELVLFKAPKNDEWFDERFEVVKFVGGVEGDTWEVKSNGVYINGSRWGELNLARVLELAPGELDGKGLVEEGMVYLLGTNPSSYDSRYWGPIEVENVRGRAHAVF